MRLHRFYVDANIEGKDITITNRDLIHQWKSVFRYNVGSQVVLFDGSGEDVLCVLTKMTHSEADLSVVSRTDRVFAPQCEVWLCIGITKKDTVETVVQKATELGVAHIVPILCERSEKKNINEERLLKIATEATEQSGRGDIPVLHSPLTIAEALVLENMPEQKIALDFDGTAFSVYKEKIPHSVAVFVGPEGGFSPIEREVLERSSVEIVSLGDNVLRAETASISVASLLLLG